jgi:hypothetical protein
VITSTLAFFQFATEFTDAGLSKLDLASWKGLLILALVLGEFALPWLFQIVRLPGKSKGERR